MAPKFLSSPVGCPRCETDGGPPAGGAALAAALAAAQGDLAALRDLGLGFVALFLEPVDEVERGELVAAAELAGASPEVSGGEGFLEEGGDAGDDKF